MSEAGGNKKLLSEGRTYDRNPVFSCASHTNKMFKIFKITAAEYKSTFWGLIPEILELL